ncbi:MAG: DMT family transporter [Treponema sp.]|nr:DMT family transporter [Treponema sp.]
MENAKTSLKGVLFLLLTAFIWGVSFVSQSVGAETLQPFSFMGIRTFMGACVLLPLVIIRDKKAKKSMLEEELIAFKKNNKKTILYGIILGLFLAIATNFQQFAFNYSTAGKIAFITAMYMFFVPLIGLFFKKRLPVVTWICIAFGFLGLYFLSFAKGAGFGDLNKGDILALICSLFFTGQILLIEKFVSECDGVKLSCFQFYTAGIISLILMFIFEEPTWPAIKAAGLALLYSGIMSCGIAYTLQVVGQKYCESSIASLIMCMESVFAVLSAAILIGEKLTGREIIGCVIMFMAIIVSQIYDGFRNKKSAPKPLEK